MTVLGVNAKMYRTTPECGTALLFKALLWLEIATIFCKFLPPSINTELHAVSLIHHFIVIFFVILYFIKKATKLLHQKVWSRALGDFDYCDTGSSLYL